MTVSFNVGADEEKPVVWNEADVKIGDEILTADFALTGWAIWISPTIRFDVTEETSVTMGVRVTASQNGAWGTFDDWYLCEDTESTHSGGTEIRGAAEATAQKEGYTGDTHCLGCGEKLESGRIIPVKDATSPSTKDTTPIVFLTVSMIFSLAALTILLRKRKTF